MQIFDSYIEAGQSLTERDRERFYRAVIEFLAYGQEPTLAGAPLAVFTAIRPSLAESAARSRSGRIGGKQTGKQTGKQNPRNRGS